MLLGSSNQVCGSVFCQNSNIVRSLIRVRTTNIYLDPGSGFWGYESCILHFNAKMDPEPHYETEYYSSWSLTLILSRWQMFRCRVVGAWTGRFTTRRVPRTILYSHTLSWWRSSTTRQHSGYIWLFPYWIYHTVRFLLLPTWRKSRSFVVF